MRKKVALTPKFSRIRSARVFPVTTPMRAHHFLHDDERNGDGDQRPEQRIAEMGACDRIGGNAARIVVHIRGDDTRSEHGQKYQYLFLIDHGQFP